MTFVNVSKINDNVATVAPAILSVTGKLGDFHATQQKGQYTGMAPRYGAFSVIINESSAVVIQGLIADIAQLTEGYDAGDEITAHYQPKAVKLSSGQLIQNNDIILMNEETQPAKEEASEHRTAENPETAAAEERQAAADAEADIMAEDNTHLREYRNIDDLADEVEEEYDDIPF